VKPVLGVIPARYASTRFSGKPLASLAGKEMIAWVIEGVLTARLIDQVWVATDDDRIARVAERMGARVAMTDSALPSGTDRIWAAVEKIDCDVVINIQGDEPLIQGSLVDSLVQPMLQDPKLEMATLAHAISEEELLSPHSVKVVVDQAKNALYFSRSAIPYSRDNARHSQLTGCLKHVGMYAYRKNFLKTFCAAPQAEIEVAESLEQLRALYLGAKIKVIQTTEKSCGVDTKDDLLRVEEILRQRK